MSKTNLQIAKPAPVSQNANKAYSGISYSLQNAELPVNRIQPSKQTIIQPKLEISSPDDEYEREADSIADKVMRMADTSVEDEKNIQAKPIAETISPLIQASGNGASENSLSGSDIESRINNPSNSGSPLPENSRTFMESSFGTDFSHVKIHTDSNAEQMNKELNAQAFTHGSDIYFNSGKFNPESSSGKHLLAHELTHVIQQFSNSVQNIHPFVQRESSSESSTNDFFEKYKTEINEIETYIKKNNCYDEYAILIDMELPSKEPRLFLVNMKQKQLQLSTYVAHGIGSGSREKAVSFSNEKGSKKTSLGIYIVGEKYLGTHGESFKMDGHTEPTNKNDEVGNNNALERYIVFHSADYMSEDYIKKHNGQPGRSWGCPAVSEADFEKLKPYLQKKIIIYIFHPKKMRKKR